MGLVSAVTFWGSRHLVLRGMFTVGTNVVLGAYLAHK
jgi:hypothetical protein